MSGLGAFHVELSVDFEANLASFIKHHYSEGQAALTTFLDLLEEVFDSLEVNPRNRKPPIQQTSAQPEKWPKKTHRQHLEFWKFYFRLPGYSVEAGEGRIMYLLEPSRCAVLPLKIYTHAEHTKRPSDKEIKRVLKPYLG